MNLSVRARSLALQLLVSRRIIALRRNAAELRRKLYRKPHVVEVFLQLDDPYSYLLSCYLPALVDAYDVELQVHLTQALGDEFRPHSDLLAVYAQKDCARLARELALPFLDKGQAPPVEYRRALVGVLAANADSQFLFDAIAAYWRGDAEAVARRVDGAGDSSGDAVLASSQALLRARGHYEVATLHHAGEWYWGVDRLHYLLTRLDALGARRNPSALPQLSAIQQASQVSLPVTPPTAAKDLPTLELFYSFRSPYSYLSLARAFAIADAFGLSLRVRPVLPMIQRGMRIPSAKLKNIGFDAVREARRLGIPVGRFSPPTGKTIDRCLSTWRYAVGERRERDFLLALGDACWNRGIDVGTDKGLRKVTGRTGLFWPGVKAALDDDSWRPDVEANRESMMESGCWGVPTLRLGEFVVWGQDRLWLLVRHLEERCDAGEGILI